MTVRPPLTAERRRKSVRPAQRETFLEALRAGWTVRHAAQHAGFHHGRAYELRGSDETFAEAWDEALEVGTQVLEDELRRRAVDGWDEDQYDGEGNLVRRVRRYSPALLIFSLKARRPDVYRDNARVEVTGANGGAIELDAGYRPTTLADVLALARDLGLAGADDELDGEAVEDAELLELEEGQAS